MTYAASFGVAAFLFLVGLWFDPARIYLLFGALVTCAATLGGETWRQPSRLWWRSWPWRSQERPDTDSSATASES